MTEEKTSWPTRAERSNQRKVSRLAGLRQLAETMPLSKAAQKEMAELEKKEAAKSARKKSVQSSMPQKT